MNKEEFIKFLKNEDVFKEFIAELNDEDYTLDDLDDLDNDNAERWLDNGHCFFYDCQATKIDWYKVLTKIKEEKR